MSWAMTTAPGPPSRAATPRHAHEGGADVVGELLVQLVGIGATDVVGLDDRVEVAHAARLSLGSGVHLAAA